MRVLVTGAGQGGTSWAREIIKCTGLFDFTQHVEDRGFPYRLNLPERYGTKLTTENRGMEFLMISRLMEVHNDLRIIFVTRHPYDNVMSKIVRGLPASQGGDKYNPRDESYTYTVESAMQAMSRAFEIYSSLTCAYSKRLLWLKMEHFIQDMQGIFAKLHEFFDFHVTEEIYQAMLNAHANNPNQFHKGRYGDEVDKSQVDLWKRWKTSFNGFFADKQEMVVNLYMFMNPIAHAWGYETIFDLEVQ